MMGFLSPSDWANGVMGPTQAGNKTPTNTFVAHTAGLGTGPDQMNEQDYLSSLVNPGIQNQQLTQQQQAGLLAQYQAQANGTGGPDIAQQELQNATQRNNAASASQQASVRGLNPALAARNIGQMQAANNQHAAGEAATLRLQQEQAAMNAQAGLLGQMQQGNLSEIGTGVSANQAQNGTNLQNVMGTQSLNQATGTTNAELQSAAQAQNKGLAGYGASAAGGALQGAAGIGAAAVAGGNAPSQGGGTPGQQAVADNAVATDTAMNSADFTDYARGGDVGHTGSDFMLSPGEEVVHDGRMETVPGQAQFAGNDYRNDTVPASLEKGDIVVPREVVEDPNPAASHAFIHAMREHHLRTQKSPMENEFHKWLGGRLAEGGVVDAPESIDDGVARMNALSSTQRRAAARHTAQGSAVRTDDARVSDDLRRRGLQDESSFFE